MSANIEARIELSDDESDATIPQSIIDKWQTPANISLDPEDQTISHRKCIRRWNQLSRLQRSIVYATIIIVSTILILLFTSNTMAPDVSQKHEKSALAQEALNNISLVIAPADDGPKKPKKTVTDFENEHKPKSPKIFPGPTNERQQAVVDAFSFAWRGYRQHAWGRDNLKPVSGAAYDWFALGLTIVDGLDTAYIMGLTREFEEGREWIKNDLVFTKNKDVNFFEVTIRVLGGLLSVYHFTLDEMFLNKAVDLGDRLMAAFSSPSGIPYSDVNLGLRTAHAPDWSHYSTTAEVATVQLELRALSRATQNPVYEEAAAAVSLKLHELPKRRGLVPIFISPGSGRFVPRAAVTLGARGDSYYEYLLKQWLQTGKTVQYLLDDYLTAIEGVRELLVKRSSPNKRVFVGELSAGSENFNPKMDHLTCFLPGTLALGRLHGLPAWHLQLAEQLAHTCYLTYAAHPTFLAPEITHFNLASATDDMYTKAADAHSLLRPEFVESLWTLHQVTGNRTYQHWGWQVFQAFEKHAKAPYGYSSVANVKSARPAQRDQMESFFLAETLKYLFLLFSDDRHLIDLTQYVLNTEAHPLPIYKH